MFFGDYITEVIQRLKLNKDDSDLREIVGRKVNSAYKEIGNVVAFNWLELERYGELRTIANYTTGTVTTTKDSRTITGSATSWTSAMVGRFFQPSGSANWYRIIRFVSATELTLQSEIIEDSGSGLTYTIWNRFYYLPSDVGKLLNFGSWVRDGQLTEISKKMAERKTTNRSLTGEPLEFSFYGVDAFSRTYNTGNVTLTKDSNVMTGSGGTEWLDNVEAGDRVTVGENVYRVNRIESDTRIILLNSAKVDVSGSSYTIEKIMNIGVQLWYNPNQSYLLPYSYRKRVFDMANEDEDEPELPDKFEKAILAGAEAEQMLVLDDQKYLAKYNLYSAHIRSLTNNAFFGNPEARVMAPKIHQNRGRYI